MSPKSSIRVVVVDDHDAVRDGICMLLSEQEDIDVVAVAESDDAAITKSVDYQPDVVVMDLKINGKGGVFATMQVTRHCSKTKVLVFSALDDVHSVKAALSAGATGYVLKRSPTSTLLASIRAVHRGARYLDPNLSDAVLEEVWPIRQISPRAEHVLTSRELDVLVLVAAGFTHSEIASQLGIKAKSVESYRARLSEKLDLHSRHQIVLYAVRHKLFALESLDHSAAGISAKEGPGLGPKKLPQRVGTLDISLMEVQKGDL